MLVATNALIRAVIVLEVYIKLLECYQITFYIVSGPQNALLTLIPFHLYRRAHSIDVEVSASGFTKDLERDGELLHPAGPEEENSEEEEEEEEDEEEEEETDEEEDGEETSVDIEEYKHAMRELEGLKVSETHGNTQDQEGEKTEVPFTARGDEETEELEEELKEAEDECPELTDLSASNKEFKPFR